MKLINILRLFILTSVISCKSENKNFNKEISNVNDVYRDTVTEITYYDSVSNSNIKEERKYLYVDDSLKKPAPFKIINYDSLGSKITELVVLDENSTSFYKSQIMEFIKDDTISTIGEIWKYLYDDLNETVANQMSFYDTNNKIISGRYLTKKKLKSQYKDSLSYFIKAIDDNVECSYLVLEKANYNSQFRIVDSSSFKEIRLPCEGGVINFLKTHKNNIRFKIWVCNNNDECWKICGEIPLYTLPHCAIKGYGSSEDERE